MAGALFLTDQTDQDRSGLIWISQNLQKKELQTRHTASRWPAPGTHAGSHLCTVPLAKDKDRVQEASRPPSWPARRSARSAVAVTCTSQHTERKTSGAEPFLDTHLRLSIFLDSYAVKRLGISLINSCERTLISSKPYLRCKTEQSKLWRLLSSRDARFHVRG